MRGVFPAFRRTKHVQSIFPALAIPQKTIIQNNQYAKVSYFEVSFLFFCFSHFNRYIMIICYCFNLCNLMTNEVYHHFLCLFVIFTSSLLIYLFRYFIYFLLAFFPLIVEFWWFFVYFGQISFIRYIFWKYFLSVSDFSLS